MPAAPAADFLASARTEWAQTEQLIRESGTSFALHCQGDWTVGDTCRHIVYAASNVPELLEALRLHGTIPGFNPDASNPGGIAKHQSHTAEQLADELAAAHAAIVAAVDALTADDLAKPCTLFGNEAPLVQWLAAVGLGHETNHRQQVVDAITGG